MTRLSIRPPVLRSCGGPVILAALLLALAPIPPQSAVSASPLLDAVKRNSDLAQQMCLRFRKLNSEGQSATSKAAIAAVARTDGLSLMDAEVLITYVIGLYCSEVF
jgi:hypothetical protein